MSEREKTNDRVKARPKMSKIPPKPPLRVWRRDLHFLGKQENVPLRSTFPS